MADATISPPSKRCEHCGAEFSKPAPKSRRQWARQKFCSHSCARIAYWKCVRPSLREAFECRVDCSDPDGCWPWTGTKRTDGYGELKHSGKTYLATHLALQFAGTPVPKGKWALHGCDNPICVRVGLGHLYVGTVRDNHDDMVRRHRSSHGERQHLAKLTAADVRLMRQLHAMNIAGVRYADFGRVFGVAGVNARAAIVGKTWRRVD